MKSDAQNLVEIYMTSKRGLDLAQSEIDAKRAELKENLVRDLSDLASQDKVFTLVLDEWRDDGVSAFQVAQSVKVIITDVVFHDRLGVAVPTLHKLKYTKTGRVKFKRGKPDTRKVQWNPFASWRVVDYLGQAVFGHSAPGMVDPERYTEEEIGLLRARLAEIQAL